MNQLDSIIEKMIFTINKEYEFDTFLIGATLPAQLYEREDKIRARFKIRGRENIKNHITRELGIKFARTTKTKVNYLAPDISINLFIDKENHVDINAKARSLTLAGRYIKKRRGLSQKQNRCAHCAGKGCSICNHSGLCGFSSVEGIITKELISLTKGTCPKFSWIGSEDETSLVLGRGRPFFVRISNPRIRRLKRSLKFTVDDICVFLKGRLSIIPSLPIKFITKTRIMIQSQKDLTYNDLKKLNMLNGATINFENKLRIVTKNIYSVRIRKKTENHFILTTVADGGLMIKQFVGGREYTKPSVSEIIGSRCECISFDILDVYIQ